METRAVKARIHGRVQGVGFRYHTQMTARSIGVTGWVRNRADGSVEVYAEGAPEALQRFEQYLHEGPPTAHVERVDSSHPEPGGEHRSFRVAH